MNIIKEKDFLDFIDYLEQPIALLTRNLCILNCNQIFAFLFQRKKSSIEKLDFSKFCKQIKISNFLDNIDLNKCDQLVIPLNYKNFNGKSFWIEWVVKPIIENNRLQYILLIGKNQQIETNNLANHLHDIVACIPGSLYWKDYKGQYLGGNNFMIKTSNLNSVEDIIGKTDYDLWPVSANKIFENDQYVIQTGKTLQVKETVIIDGKKMHFTGVKMPLHDENGKIIGVIGNSLEITKQIETEEYLKTISASLAHEIKTPLAGIRIGLSNMKFSLNQIGKLPEQARQAEIKNMETYIDKLVNRLDAGVALMDIQLKNMRMEKIDSQHFQPLSIKLCIAQALETFPFENKEVINKINLNLKTDFIFLGDKVLTKHLIWNLLNNALHFIRAEQKGEIFIETYKRKEKCILSFRDTAKGISPTEAKRVFEQFYSNREGGSGLGLTFCHMLINAYGGRISCTGKIGEYAKFLLTFPEIIVPTNC